MNSDRRTFLFTTAKTGCSILCGAFIANVLAGCDMATDNQPVSSIPVEDSPIIDLNKESALQKVGGAVKKRISSINSERVIIVIRTSDQTFAALSAQCTHQGSEVNLPTNNVIVCPSHGSRFNAATGGVIQGPAASPLTKFSATFNATNNTVTIG
jgi:Rieske Fe-S protein